LTSFRLAISPEALNAEGIRLRELLIHPSTNPNAERPGGMAEPIIAEWMHYHRPVQPDGVISPSCGASAS
jgi:hypothetical protein